MIGKLLIFVLDCCVSASEIISFACDRCYGNDNFVSCKTGQVITLKLFSMDFAFSRFVNDSRDRVDHFARLKIISLLG